MREQPTTWSAGNVQSRRVQQNWSEFIEQPGYRLQILAAAQSLRLDSDRDVMRGHGRPVWRVAAWLDCLGTLVPDQHD